MITNSDIQIVLLAMNISIHTGDKVQSIIKMAKQIAEQELSSPAKEKREETMPDDVEEIYKLYPTKCPQRGASTGKCSQDKARIKRLIERHGVEAVRNAVINYIGDCQNSGSYLKNFSTLLNNLPIIENEESTIKKSSQWEE